MMKVAKALEKYFTKRVTTLDLLLERPKYKYTLESYHKLRVEIKKLNALFKLVDYSVAGFKRKKYFKPLKNIFAQAGKVRELQLEDAMLKKLALHYSLKNYRYDLKKHCLKEQEKFFHLSNEEVVSELQKDHTKIASFFYKIQEKDLKDYLEKRRKKVDALLKQKKINEQQIHELRMRLQEFYYNRKSVNFPGQGNLLIKAKALQKLLGKWHDRKIMNVHFKKVMSSGKTNPMELKKLEMIQKKISIESERLFKKINSAIHAATFLFD